MLPRSATRPCPLQWPSSFSPASPHLLSETTPLGSPGKLSGWSNSHPEALCVCVGTHPHDNRLRLIIAEGDHATELGVCQKEGSIGFGMDERMECLRFDPYAATSKVSGGTAQISAISVVDSQHWLPVKGHRACLECRRYDFRRTGGTLYRLLGCLF